ncbi:peptide deformylase [Candidatus Vidania fulgoroideorum]
MIVYYPNKILQCISRKARKSIVLNISEAFDVMKNIVSSRSEYIGIAAVQIGLLRRIVIIKYIGLYMHIANPIVLWRSKRMVTKMEGCISIPYVNRLVTRCAYILISYRNNRNIRIRKTLQWNNAICIQHEIDHLNGKLINDYKKVL